MDIQKEMKEELGSGLFSPVKSSKKSDEVYSQLVNLIRNGHFKPGVKLPPERDMAADFKISRQTIREALYRAEMVGLIEVRHGTGSFVVSSAPREPLETPVREILEKEAHRIFEFFDIRRLIEGWCAARAATLATAVDLERLNEKLERMRELDLTTDEWEQTDLEFHVIIARTTDNPLAIRIMEILGESFRTFYRFKRRIPNSENKERIWQLHYDIYDAIRKRNPQLATRKIIDHMDFLESGIKEGMGNIQS